MSLLDYFVNERLRKVRDKEAHIHYLGKYIQNELISVLGNAVQDKILSAVHEAEYFSIMLDCTSDVSHVEQMTTPGTKGRFFPVSDTTGAGLTINIFEKFEDMALPIPNLRGQGSDYGSDMKGGNIDLQL
ncbi:hypothetical protein PR048_028528 [Dryococelus australis]|uniref:DUF4371 domain-containing protein n=1 Tax=Dryococelus australis TaxID=614101 RepID=A0ABQ9GBI0_9NEOP|nr:hypothetical protein PR048_028528 [Dryococelus australis]